jgi:hypothetical protein
MRQNHLRERGTPGFFVEINSTHLRANIGLLFRRQKTVEVTFKWRLAVLEVKLFTQKLPTYQGSAHRG